MEVAAFGLAFASAILAYGGAAMQAFEARSVPRRESLRAGLLIRLLGRPLWLGGTALNILAFGLQVAALSLASLAIVQPTLALGLVVLVVIAAWKLGETIEKETPIGIAAVIAGLVGLAFVAPRRNHIPESGLSIGVLGAVLAVIVGVLLAMRLTGRSGGLAASVAAGVTYAWVSFAGALLGTAFAERSWTLAAVWSVGVVAGAALALTAEMTALQSWPVSRSKPVVFVLQTLIPSFAAPFFSAQGFGALYGVPFAISLVVVAAGAATVASSGAFARTQA
ncbi:MAG TPA: hypothetical protein VFA97_02370 [Gaiellaceae bacterium]|nr:hypothetical protein [Gaiellaceae bacterium]